MTPTTEPNRPTDQTHHRLGPIGSTRFQRGCEMPQYGSEPMCSTVTPLRRPSDPLGLVLGADSDRPVMTTELARALSTIVRRLHAETVERQAA
jgi:hypothetical protein